MTLFAFIGMPGPMEIAIICALILLIFGPKQVPKVMRSLGGAIPSFRRGMEEANLEIAEFKSATAKAEAEARQAATDVAKNLSKESADA